MNNIVKKLIKEYIAFNPVLLNDNRPKSKLSTDTVKDILNVISVNEVNILWDDLSVYTLEYIKENKPSGYPIGINVVDNKYLSLKYMSKQAPTKGSNTYIDIQFCKKEKTPKAVFDDSLTQDISDLKVELKNGVFKLLDDE